MPPPAGSRPACLRCSDLHKRCEYAAADGPCGRCRRLGRKCEPSPAPIAVVRKIAKRGGGPPGTRTDAGPVGGAARVRVGVPPGVPAAWTAPSPSLLYARLAMWWDGPSQVLAVVHREAFEGAFLKGGSPVYGPNPPAALLSAIAAEGALGAGHLPGIGAADRRAFGLALVARARDLLLAGFLSRDPGHRPMSGVEAAQTCLVLSRLLFGADRGLEASLMVAAGARVAAACLRDIGDGILELPKDKWQWVAHECVLRCGIHAGLVSASAALHAKLEFSADLFASPLPLPCHELFFEMRPAVHAHAVLRTSFVGAGLPLREIVDPGPLLSRVPDPAACADAARAFVAPVFRLRASRYAVLHLFSVLEQLVHRLREDAALAGLDLVSLATQDPADDTPAERAFRLGSDALTSCIVAASSAVPLEFGVPLSQGDPLRLLARAAALLSTETHAHALVGLFACIHSLPAWLWLQPPGSHAAPGPAYFASGALMAVLEHAAVAADLMRAQTVLGAARCVHQNSFTCAIKVAALYLAAAGTVREPPAREHAAEGARAALGLAEAVLAGFPIAARAKMPLVRRMVADSGVPLAIGDAGGSPPPLPGAPGSDGSGRKSGQVPFLELATATDPIISAFHVDGEAEEPEEARAVE
ncbi:hypothetical protein DFJ74DRAFT_684697 [Hyaloraphidium curvatum]|nr:hypothetical protein DFJ74DRAFT_684697 [Hyaloraphidium curvatum]